MKSVVFILLFLISVNAFAQKLSSSEFHTHRQPLQFAFQKFQKEKKGKVVFLGGSITYNPGWRDSVCNYLQKKFPETSFNFINAGIPSMGSTPGAFRFGRDVLQNDTVDLLFEEAAVNDATNNRSPKEIILAMEGIVRHAKRENLQTNVVLMYFVDPDKIKSYRNSEVPEVIQLHEKVAEHYSVSSINLAKEVTQRIDAGEFTWENDFKNLHPSEFGQGIYAHSIITFFEKEWHEFQMVNEIAEYKLPQQLNQNSYCSGKLVEVSFIKNAKGWELIENWTPADEKGTRFNFVNVPMLVGEFPTKVLKFRFNGNAVGIAVAAGHDAGIIEYKIDNSPWQTQDLFTKWSRQLHLPWYFTLGSGLKNKEHILKMRVSNKKNENSTGQRCVIRYFYYNQNDKDPN